MSTVLRPILQPTPGTPPTHNFGLCETFSYIPVEGAGRPLYARASYVTNFSDMSIHLSAGELSIGAVTIKDNNTGLNCDVVSDPDNGLNALRVITQDLESIYDDITIGDKNGIYYATIDGPLSSLNVKVTNLSALENSLQNQIILLDSLSSLILKEFDETQILLLSSFLETNTNLSSFQLDFNLQLEETQTLLDSLTSLQEDKQNQVITLLHQLTSNTDSLEINTDSVETLIISSNTLLNSLTSLNQKEFNETQTLLDSLTSLQEDKQNQVITLLHQLTANTDGVETLIDSLTSLSLTEFNETQTLLDSLTSLQNVKQDSIITLLHQLTANTDELKINTDEVESLIIQSNTLLNSLTSLLQDSKQSETITLLNELTSNTNEIETIILNSNYRLDALTATNFATVAMQESIVTLLDVLSSNTDEIEQLIQTSNTLLDALTSKPIPITDVLNIETKLNVLTGIDYATSSNQNQTNTFLDTLTTSNVSVPGWSIPPYDEISLEYVGSTDIFRKVTYLNNSTQVLTLSFLYVTEPPTTGNAIIKTVKKI